jgi:hypothetical protein
MKHLVVALLTAWLPFAASAQSVETTFDSHGVPIHYVMSGAGKPIVLIHGFAATSEMWDRVRAELSSRRGCADDAPESPNPTVQVPSALCSPATISRR